MCLSGSNAVQSYKKRTNRAHLVVSGAFSFNLQTDGSHQASYDGFPVHRAEVHGIGYTDHN